MAAGDDSRWRRAGTDGGWDFAFAFAFGGRVGEGFNFVRDYYFGFNSSFYGSLGIIMNRGVAERPWARKGGQPAGK